MNKLLLIYILLASLLWLYSYGFVDFNLTLSSHPLITAFIDWTQQLAMFHRSTSLLVYLGLLGMIFVVYLLLNTRYHSLTFPWKPIIIIGLIFSLAYPFLSSDVFKYLFSAKTVLFYHANPHVIAPQVFEGDLWLRFMRWIHTPSPYGPVQTILTIPYYVISLGKFTPMLYLYKLDQLFWYGLTIWCIGKLGGSVRARLFFALNPLVLYEWLANAHNDASMIALLLLSLYLTQIKNTFWALATLGLSVGIKYVTILALPLILIRKLSRFIIIHGLLVMLTLAPILYHYSWQYQPWYVTWIIPFAALSPYVWARWTVIAYSFGALLRYIPFIQIGLWQGSALYFAILTFVPPILVGLYFILLYFVRRTHNQL